MGNTHQEFTIDGGTTWTDVPFPAGGAAPASAPFACCDEDVVYDQARGLTISLVLYLDAARTRGVVRMWIRRAMNLAPNCFYDYDPGAGVLPDYPHINLSNDRLYLTTNEGATHRVWRLDLDQMADCVATSAQVFSSAPAVGQRVVVPVDGARETMYWAYHENNTQLRIFSWPETAAAPTSTLRTVTLHNHVNPDCRGGANNTDWIEHPGAYGIFGFNMRGAVGGGKIGWWWNVSADAAAGHNQAHIHATVFNTVGLTLISQPHVFQSELCWGYPNVAANERGDFGMVAARGGLAGGGALSSTAVQGYVGLDDDYTTGVGAMQWLRVAIGTHNTPAFPGRYGDYLGIHAAEPCDNVFVAAPYAMYAGSGVANVNARYVEFMRGRDKLCYDGWKDETR